MIFPAFTILQILLNVIKYHSTIVNIYLTINSDNDFVNTVVVEIGSEQLEATLHIVNACLSRSVVIMIAEIRKNTLWKSCKIIRSGKREAILNLISLFV